MNRRPLALAALPFAAFLIAAPAWAQEVEERVEHRIVIEGDAVIVDGEGIEIEEEVTVERHGDGEIIVRRRGAGADGATGRSEEFRLRGPLFPLGEAGPMLGALADRLGNLDLDIETFDAGGEGSTFRLGLGGEFTGASGETRERIRELEGEARALARDLRNGNPNAEAELDRVLGDLFEARGDARREAAERLRERARELMADADAMESAARDREQERARLVEDRKRVLLGRTGADW